jgi:putative ABC transport system substrate-binding protein
MWRQTALLVGRVLKGQKPAQLPVEEPSRYELVINLKAAQALELQIPEAIRLRADAVIQ